jgi:hypothetical protein
MVAVVNPRRWLAYLAPGALLALSVGGCANAYEEITSREFKVKSLWTKAPPPLEIIKTSDDNGLRAKAYLALKEPAQKGGSAEDQELYLQLLTTTARDDREPLCRLAAIRALGGYKDPRAIRMLEEVYQQARLPFTQEFNSMIRQQALVGLEKNGDDKTRHLLIRVASQPGPSTDATLTDRQQTQDERLIAVRALGRYKQQECIETLAHLHKTEKDIAIRNRAHDSLELVTGRKLPEEPDAITADLLVPLPQQDPGIIQRVSAWVRP